MLNYLKYITSNKLRRNSRSTLNVSVNGKQKDLSYKRSMNLEIKNRLQGAGKKIRSLELKENLLNGQAGAYMIKRKVLDTDEGKSRNQTELKWSNGWLKKFLPPYGFVLRRTIVSS